MQLLGYLSIGVLVYCNFFTGLKGKIYEKKLNWEKALYIFKYVLTIICFDFIFTIFYNMLERIPV